MAGLYEWDAPGNPAEDIRRAAERLFPPAPPSPPVFAPQPVKIASRRQIPLWKVRQGGLREVIECARHLNRSIGERLVETILQFGCIASVELTREEYRDENSRCDVHTLIAEVAPLAQRQPEVRYFPGREGRREIPVVRIEPRPEPKPPSMWAILASALPFAAKPIDEIRKIWTE